VEKPSRPLREAKFGDSSQMQPGDWVMAIGNPFEFAHTVTVGVISAVGRPFAVAEQRYQNVLQTDAAINPGNSGGPLLNLRGEVIGINTAIISNARTPTNIGIGFAIPINVVRDLLPQLRAGKVVRGRIGVTVQPVPPDSVKDFGLSSRQGAMVMSVANGGPADKAGVKPGDVVVEFNGQPVSNNDELVRLVTGTKPGATVPMKVMRDKQEKTLTITVAELNLEEESGRSGRGEGGEDNTAETGFGLTLDNLTPEMARRLRVPSGTTGAVITDVDPGNTSTGVCAEARACDPGDQSRAESRAPRKRRVPFRGSRRAAGRILLVWRQGQQVFVTVRKE
jgi:serine protease Do